MIVSFTVTNKPFSNLVGLSMLKDRAQNVQRVNMETFHGSSVFFVQFNHKKDKKARLLQSKFCIQSETGVR